MSGNEQILSIEQLAGLTPEQVLKLIDDAWPWPLDAVQSWFENLYNQIQAWFSQVAGWTYNLVKPAIDAVWGWVSSWATWLWDSISPQFTLVWGWIQGIIAPIVAAISTAVLPVFDWLQSAITSLANQVLPQFAQVWNWLSAGFASVTTLVTTGLASLGQTLREYSTAVLNAVQGINAWFSNEFIDPFIDWLLQFPGKMVEALRNFFVDQWQLIWGFWSRDWNWLKLLTGMVLTFAGGAIVLAAPAIGAALIAAVKWLGGVLLFSAAGWGVFFKSLLPRIAGWFAANWVPILGSSALLGLQATGQLEQIIDKYVTPGITGVFNMFEAMGPVSPGVRGDAHIGITKLATFTVSGLAAMTLAGEALSPLKHIGLGNIAAIVYDLINYKTLTAAFMGVLAYVYIKQPLTYYYNKVARPEIPNEGQLIRLAGEYAIDRQTFTDYMQFHGYPDVWIDRLWELADRPFSPRMLTQLAQAGVVDDELIDRELHNAGYNEASIPYLKTWLRREADGGAKTLMASTAITRYTQGFDTEQVMRQNLQALGVADSVMDKYVFGANLSSVYDYQTDLKAYWVDAYHRRDIEEPELRSRLILAGVQPNRLDLIVEAQRIKRLAAPKPPADKTLALQFDTIRDRRKKNLITRDEEIRQLVYIGETLDYARAVADNDDVALAPADKPVKDKVLQPYETPAGKVQVDTIRDLRVAGQITRGAELSRLLALKMPVDIANAIADNDDAAIERKPVKAPRPEPAPYETESGKLDVSTIRAQRVNQDIDRAGELAALKSLEMPEDIALAMADSDDQKVAQKIEALIKPELALYETEAGKLQVDTIRRARRARSITADAELAALAALAMPVDLAQAYVANDELRLAKVAASGA